MATRDDPEQERLRAALRSFIADKGTQDAAAQALGYTQERLSQVLSKPENVSMKLARALAKVKRCTVDDLMRAPPSEGPRVEREPQPAYSESEAPLNFNLPNWDALASATLGLDGAEGVPECFVEIVGYDNGVLTGPLRPVDILKLAKLSMQYRTPEAVEAMLVTLRAKYGRPPLRVSEKAAKGK